MQDLLTQGQVTISPCGALRGLVRVPGDKSISHRAVMLASLADGTTRIHNFLESEDCLRTLNAFKQMGVKSDEREDSLLVHGRGVNGLSEPADVLDMGNSGTGTRLLLGVLAGQNFAATLTGDSSLRKRPMRRVTEPLLKMGAFFVGRDQGNQLPLSVQGGALQAIDYPLPVASAQIKSALLLAGLFANGTTVVHEPGPSRDHTERMLRAFGAKVESHELSHSIAGGQPLTASEVSVPGDLSSAAFFVVAASIVEGSDIVLESVGVNPTRTGILDVLQKMGADITLENRQHFSAEPVADIHVKSAPLHGVTVSGDLVVRMIDEFPIFAVAAAFASGPSKVEGAEELRVKESDRIATTVNELGKMGAVIQEQPDGFIVEGHNRIQGAACRSHGDHRIAMALAVAALAAKGRTQIHGTAPIATSFPNFFELLNQLAPGSYEPIT